jgi:hypothetical protein
VRLTKTRRLLKRREVYVSYATVHRFAIEELGFGRRAPTIPVADCGPGEEVQLDVGRVGWLRPDESGRRRHFKAWIFTAVRSRHRFVYPVLTETTATAIEACEAAWGFFGGVLKVVIPDNTKAIVSEPDPLEPLLNLPRKHRGRKLDARADRHIVCFYERGVLIKTHLRVGPGQRQTDAADFPPEQAACALRDRAFFERRAAEHGESVGIFAKRLLDGPLQRQRVAHEVGRGVLEVLLVPGLDRLARMGGESGMPPGEEPGHELG